MRVRNRARFLLIIMKQYDYIFTGAGASGLSLLARMIATGRFSNKKILLIDKVDKRQNDRTWCFWEKQAGFFEPIISKKYEKLWFTLMDTMP